jgi:hypothetical protein
VLPNDELGWKYMLKQGVRILRLDTNMCRKLSQIVAPTLCSIVDVNTELVAPRSAKVAHDMRVLKSKISKISFETEVYWDEDKQKFQRRKSEEYIHAEKKAEKYDVTSKERYEKNLNSYHILLFIKGVLTPCPQLKKLLLNH